MPAPVVAAVGAAHAVCVAVVRKIVVEGPEVPPPLLTVAQVYERVSAGKTLHALTAKGYPSEVMKAVNSFKEALNAAEYIARMSIKQQQQQQEQKKGGSLQINVSRDGNPLLVASLNQEPQDKFKRCLQFVEQYAGEALSTVLQPDLCILMLDLYLFAEFALYDAHAARRFVMDKLKDDTLAVHDEIVYQVDCNGVCETSPWLDLAVRLYDIHYLLRTEMSKRFGPEDEKFWQDHKRGIESAADNLVYYHKRWTNQNADILRAKVRIVSPGRRVIGATAAPFAAVGGAVLGVVGAVLFPVTVPLHYFVVQKEGTKSVIAALASPFAAPITGASVFGGVAYHGRPSKQEEEKFVALSELAANRKKADADTDKKKPSAAHFKSSVSRLVDVVSPSNTSTPTSSTLSSSAATKQTRRVSVLDDDDFSHDEFFDFDEFDYSCAL